MDRKAAAPDGGRWGRQQATTAAVVIVHGLWMGPWAMAWLARRLAAQGLRAIRFGYDSMRKSLDGNAADLARFAAGIDAPQVHLLGHSLGGILIFRALDGGGFRGDGRVVMLGAPLMGSYAAERLARFGTGRKLLGRNMLDWLAAPASRWTPPNELGVIAGTRAIGLGRVVAPGLPQPNDGVVGVDETRIPGAKEVMTLKVAHTEMLVSAGVARHAADFLRRGSFMAGGGAP